MATPQSTRLLQLARRLADALPPDVAQEIVLTGSVSRAVADDLSDVEMLVVTPEPLSLDAVLRARTRGGLHPDRQLGAAGRPHPGAYSATTTAFRSS